MNLKVLFMLLIYYAVCILFFTSTGSPFSGAGFNVTNTINSSGITASEIDTGGIFGTGISFFRYVALIGFGIGLPSDTPVWFSVFFAMWQSIFTIFSIGFIISSIWDG